MDAKVELPVGEKVKLAVRGLNFYYGGFHALKNIDLDIPAKKVTAFIGPSGCGKSTLLRTFNRMFELYPDQRAEGSIMLDGENILDSREDVSLIRASTTVGAGGNVIDRGAEERHGERIGVTAVVLGAGRGELRIGVLEVAA